MNGYLLSEGRLGAVICAVLGAIGAYGVATGHAAHWLTTVAFWGVGWALWCENNEQESEDE